MKSPNLAGNAHNLKDVPNCMAAPPNRRNIRPIARTSTQSRPEIAQSGRSAPNTLQRPNHPIAVSVLAGK